LDLLAVSDDFDDIITDDDDHVYDAYLLKHPTPDYGLSFQLKKPSTAFPCNPDQILSDKITIELF